MAARSRTSLTTVDQFLPMIADLPLAVVERNRFGGIALVPTETDPELAHLFRALDIAATKRGLRARRGVTVFTVNGFAKG